MISVDLNIHKMEYSFYHERKLANLLRTSKRISYIVSPASITSFEMICFAFNFKFNCSYGIKSVAFEFRFSACWLKLLLNPSKADFIRNRY